MSERTWDEIENEIYRLKLSLTSNASETGDWKIAKYNEYVAAGLNPPFDIAAFHAAREAIREEIRALEAELDG
ncbi:hypothetical protein [Synergistes jonesii]|uniref:Uncharacterized protein n=1 Tax=Synergistes jonesii TaxID=2754 RepID=A0A073IUB6_9BACT|nr:hypothetical protein [Synergistes jonesii]KEJ93031.1 hypothetical protein EH55_13320 [Synergistes jonesii]KEJ93452.1 hypothetical protein EH55_01350 [Synergistes jonesii]OFB61475.1 hypothetical protein JS72_11100 [Synergistes jonesii]OFB65246.1 hypothetical protein JS73_00005 [Synergistes jonesii]OFB68771.1 hypothetical protein JS79_00005 [Synergistes jonesii]